MSSATQRDRPANGRRTRSWASSAHLLGLALAAASSCAAGAGSLLDLQRFAVSQTLETASGQAVELINLNPNVASQYILRIGKRRFHLQFARHSEVTLVPAGLRYVYPGEAARTCTLATPTSGPSR